MTTDAIAAIDIGGTKIALGLADTEGGEPVFHRFPTRLGDGPRRIMEAALGELERMAGERGARVVAAGVGCGGPLDRGRGLILSPPNLPGWDEFPVVRMVEERLGVPVLLDNDANAAALGEHEYGAGRGFRHLIYLTISTGIGGGIIIGGRLVHGVGDGAGEVGHMVVEPGGPPCPCGGRGCLEALCSGTSIARRAAEALSRGDRPSTLLEAEEVTARAVAEAAARGDALAAEVWDETVRYLALGLSNIIAVLAPEAIILGGGVSTAGEQLLTPLRRLVRESVRIMPVERVRILQAALGADSAVYGALLLGRAALSTSSRV
ncbi:MAG TPA: ROK family protein [Pyrinomonadaceae bacterium]|jgi:glucokinase|nr:ROK family protein [Pyrinomonadaceae bacterium]